jgi:hypothetical protein
MMMVVAVTVVLFDAFGTLFMYVFDDVMDQIVQDLIYNTRKSIF